jgi:hypothetical protein
VLLEELCKDCCGTQQSTKKNIIELCRSTPLFNSEVSTNYSSEIEFTTFDLVMFATLGLACGLLSRIFILVQILDISK